MAIAANQKYLDLMGPQSKLTKQPGSLKAWAAPVIDPAKQAQQARDAVQLEYGQKQRGLENAGLDAIAQYNRLVDEEQEYAREADPRIANIYSALQTSLGQNQAENQETYGDAVSQIRGWYDQAYGANNQLNQEAMSRITGDAERLGIQAGIPGGTQRMTEDFLYNQGQNRNAQAGRSANMAELAAKIEALDRNRVGAAGREGGQQRAILANEIAQTIGDLGMNHYNEMRTLRSEQAGMSADRGAAERDALREFEQRDFQNTQTARGNSLQEFLARAGLGLQQSEFRQGNYEADRNFGLAKEELGLSRDELALNRELGLGDLDVRRTQTAAEIAQAQRDDSLKWAQLRQDQVQWEREMAEATSPEARARAAAELARIKAETNALGVQAVSYPAGEIGFQQFAKDNQMPTEQVQAARRVIDYAQKKGDPNFAFAMLSAGYNHMPNFQERYGFRWRPEDTQALRNLVSVYYAGTGGK